MTKDAGREHWTPVMSMLVAGGRGKPAQVIGSTDRRGGEIKTRKVTPSDLAATVFHHLDIPLDTNWTNPTGRPHPGRDRGRAAGQRVDVSGSSRPLARVIFPAVPVISLNRLR